MTDAKPTPDPAPSHYPYRRRIDTRWTDNDVYGHVNNAVYYQYFDSVINDLLIRDGGLDIHGGKVVGFIVRSECDFLHPVRYPSTLEVGVGIERLGRSSVTYAVALFVAGEPQPCARGRMVHVFVDTETSRPVELPARIRKALEPLRLA
jgi:acyl-CoA thioester hydrolase